MGFFSLKNKINYKSYYYNLYLYYNLYIKEKIFLKKKSYSQFSEDLEIKKFFTSNYNGIYVDIGCYHPTKFSNTALLYQNGWRGYNIDINKLSVDLFNIARPNDKNINVSISNQSGKEVIFYYNNLFSALNSLHKDHLINFKVKNINQSRVKCKKFEEIVDENFDFLNIDCEGHDFEIIKLINLKKYNPKLICIEINEKNHREINEYLKNNNYSLKNTLGLSAIYLNKN